MEETQEPEFGELRALCAYPCADSFVLIKAWITALEARAPGVYRHKWSNYVRGHLESWPMRDKFVSISQLEDADLSEAPWTELVESVRIDELDLSDHEVIEWLITVMRVRFPNVRELGLCGSYSKKGELERLARAGLFDELESLYFESYPLHASALKAILEHLTRRHTKLTSLGLVGCDVTPNKLDTLCRSPLCAQLTHLDLSDNRQFELRGSRVLAEKATLFESLTHLTLESITPRLIGLEELLDAPWPAGLEQLVLTPYKLDVKHFRILEERGAVSKILPSSGRVTHYILWRCEQESFEIMSRAGLWEHVEALEITNCKVSDFSALGGPDVSLKRLMVCQSDPPEHSSSDDVKMWDTLKACVCSDALEEFKCDGMDPPESWWRDVLTHRGEALERVHISQRCSDAFMDWMLKEGLFKKLEISGLHVTSDMIGEK